MSKISEKAHTFIDRMRLKAHLAGMEAKDVWDKIEPELTIVSARVGEFEGLAHQASDDARLQAHLGMMEARERWQGLRDHFDRFCKSMADEGQFVISEFDQTRLKAHLAKMEAKDVLKEHTETWLKEFREAKAQAKADAHNFCNQLGADLTDFINMLPR